MIKINTFSKTIIFIVTGVATSITPSVLLTYGIGQFNIVRIVGEELATWWFSIALGLVSLSVIFLNPLGGYVFDKTRSSFGKRRVWIFLGSIFGFISMQGFAYASDMVELIFYWVSVSFSYGLVTLAYFVLIPEQFKSSNYGKISGLVGTLIPLVIMVISMIILGGYSYLAVEDKIILISYIQLICNVLAIYFLDESEKEEYLDNKNEMKDVPNRYFYPSFKEHKNFTWTLLSRLCINFVSSGLSMMTLFYMARFNLNEKEIFELHAITASGVILMVVFGIYSGYLSDRVNKKKPFIIFSSFATALCMFLYSTSESIILVIAFSFIYQCVFGVFNAVDLALVNQVLPSEENYAKDIAIMNTTTHIAKSVISFMTPALLVLGAQWMGDDGYTLFFIVLAISALLSVFFVSRVSEAGRE